MLTAADLNAYVGLHIRDICPNRYQNDADNHCAHFVSHVLGLRFGATCAQMTGRVAMGTDANIRVHEIFARCPSAGTWDNLPFPLFVGLAFVTNAAHVNVRTKVMNNVPRKHIGIFLGGGADIWHYSNSRRQVVTQPPSQFMNHYPAPDNAMFWGSLP
ncbi:MAG TPA: hypothetical protein VNN80_33310 [Polyangiaceae bacterium]|jgi:hypothetical protein|nr:hypothetical protein [Polyangiaceae bacterium]